MRSWPVFALCLALTGCYAPTIPSGGACSTSCPGDQICVSGTCRDSPLDASPVIDTVELCPDPHDEDQDGVGDACDPCPHVASASPHADQDMDGVGDACDPQPAIAKQAWVLFDPFVTKRAEWTDSSAATFANDRMTLAPGYIRLLVANGELRIATSGQLSNLGALPRQHVIELGEHPDGSYYYAETYQDSEDAYVKITKYNGTTYSGVAGHDLPGGIPVGAFSWVIDESVGAQTIGLAAQYAGVAYPRVQAATAAPNLEASGYLMFGTKSMTATYDYVAIIRTTP